MAEKTTSTAKKKVASRPKSIADVLIQSKLITVDQYKDVLRKKDKSQSINDALIAQKVISEGQLADALSKLLNIPRIPLAKHRVKSEAMKHADYAFAQKHVILPLSIDKGKNELFVAMSDPLNYFVIENLELSSGMTVKPQIATRAEILFAINKHYGAQAAGNAGSAGGASGAEGRKLDSTVVQLLEHILVSAIQLKASDIHLDPEETYTAVRYRVDGELRQVRRLQQVVHSPMVARVKILSSLDITQTRTPQDGRFNVTLSGIQADMRVSCLPTVNGEKIVIRILDASDADRKISELGFSEDNEKVYSDLLKRPSGLVLVTGPTGSGKSSTLYASIQQVNQSNVNVMTIEDPVELHMEGINQVQVNADAGLTFAAGLRSILRQDPNVIMIGEIRDQETAEIAIRSALTGHLVLSTLHTNSAVDAIPRMVDMGVEPYLVSSAVKGIIAQRLVRKICADCKVKRAVTPGEDALFKSQGHDISHIYEAKGCDTCAKTGYKGRMAIHEVVLMDDVMKQTLLTTGKASDLRSHVKSLGTKFLIDDGFDKIKAGLTSIDEVLKIAVDA